MKSSKDHAGRPASTNSSEPEPHPRFDGEIQRIVRTDCEIAILRRPEGDVDWNSTGWLLLSFRDQLRYSVEYAGSWEQAEELAYDLVAPNLATHRLRTAFEMRTVYLTADLAEATGQTTIQLPLLRVLEVSDDDPLFVVGSRHRLTLNPSVIIPSDLAERRRNEARGRDSAYHAAVFESRDARIRAALQDDAELPSPRY